MERIQLEKPRYRLEKGQIHYSRDRRRLGQFTGRDYGRWPDIFVRQYENRIQ